MLRRYVLDCLSVAAPPQLPTQPSVSVTSAHGIQTPSQPDVRGPTSAPSLGGGYPMQGLVLGHWHERFWSATTLPLFSWGEQARAAAQLLSVGGPVGICISKFHLPC